MDHTPSPSPLRTADPGHGAAPPPPPAPRKRAGPMLYLTGLVLLIAAGFGTFRSLESSASNVASARTAMETEAARGPRVVVATVAQGPAIRTIQLLGDARAYSTATMFAKVSGYLKSVAVDKGDLVTTGQIIAEIESTELESQYQSAVADLDNKQRIATRARDLLRSGSTAQQAADQAETNLRMAQESVRNLNAIRSYQVLRAPFDGMVVARFADPGALLQAATTNQASSLPVIQLADTTKLRIGAFVEQRDVSAIKAGDEADIIDASNTERRRTARISRTAGSLDPRTRTLFIEIDLDNKDNFLVPGSFVQVVLKVPVTSYPQIPVNAVLQRGPNTVVAVVGADETVRFRPIRVASTDGIVSNIAEGLKPGEKVGLNVPNDVIEGAKIRAAAAR
jgi:RND family efflux transporter MFP subunit